MLAKSSKLLSKIPKLISLSILISLVNVINNNLNVQAQVSNQNTSDNTTLSEDIILQSNSFSPNSETSSETENTQTNLTDSLTVEKFDFEGNTVFSKEELGAIKINFDKFYNQLFLNPNFQTFSLNSSLGNIRQTTNFDQGVTQKLDTFDHNNIINNNINFQDLGLPISEITHQKLSFFELDQIAKKIAEFYYQQGYQTSGAIINLGETLPLPEQPVIVTIKIREGTLEDIQVILKDKSDPNIEQEAKEIKNGRLANYIQSRLKVEVNKPLNVTQLLEALQLLKLDPLIEELSATLGAGSTTQQSILIVEYRPTNILDPVINLDNSRPPSVGTFQRGITLTGNNLLGLGDIISADYNNTDGSNGVDINYTLPVNPHNGTISFDYNWTDNEVIESPFDDIDQDGNSPDITSDSRTYELTLRQPLIQTINNQKFQEFSIGLTGSWRESQSYLLDVPFPLSPGAEEDGETHLFALRFFQEFTEQDAQQVFALRSQFNFGIDAFNATINEQFAGIDPIPDSTFFYWQGQAQYIRLLTQDTLFLLRGNIQISNQALLPMEQFATGGFGSVEGYRQDQLLTDNGLFLSAEIQFPIVKIAKWNSVVHIIPFIDYGTTWNTGRDNPEDQTLSSVGLGLQWRIDDNFKARLDYGIPLVDVNSRDKTLQEQGLYFSVQFTPN